MLRLKKSILHNLLLYSVASPVCPLHRLLSMAAPAVSQSRSFAIEEYLFETCGLTRAQPLKASSKLPHIKSPSKPDVVLAFLAGLGLSSTDIAAVVARDPRFLCTGVERTLGPIILELNGLGVSRSDVARLVLLRPHEFRRRSIVSKLQYCLPLFGSSGLSITAPVSSQAASRRWSSPMLPSRRSAG
jgi:mTERF domain-containing protein